MDPLQRATLGFEKKFDTAPSHCFRAPGRVNLIGEHTDYNDGFVLPCAIDFFTCVAIRQRDDSQVNVVALDFDAQLDQFELDSAIVPSPTYRWANYVRGTLAQLMKITPHLRGMDIAISGNVPQGAGLSSSASLEVVLGVACNQLNDLGLSRSELALAGQAAEHEFVGTKCGIMDQLISAQGKANHALLIDCRSLDTRLIRMPDNIAVLIVDSKVTRGLVDSEYNLRRQQCQSAADLLGIPSLRDIDEPDFINRQAELPALVARRARHVVTENARTLAAARALAAGDLTALSGLMAASHHSMRDDFEITVPEIDTLLSLMGDVIGDLGGVRMTGGGFGGCVVALVPTDAVTDVVKAVDADYERLTNLPASIHVCTATDGAGSLTLDTR